MLVFPRNPVFSAVAKETWSYILFTFLKLDSEQYDFSFFSLSSSCGSWPKHAFLVLSAVSSFLWSTGPYSCSLSCTAGHVSHVQKAWLICASSLQTEADSSRLSTPGFCSQALIKLSPCFLQSLLSNSVIWTQERGPPTTWSHMAIICELLKFFSNRDYVKKLYNSIAKHTTSKKMKTVFEKKNTLQG